MKHNLNPVLFLGFMLAFLVTLLAPIHPAYASDRANATYVGTIDVNSVAKYRNTTAQFYLTTAVYQSGHYISSNCNNTAITTATGVDVPYMPAVNANNYWSLWVDDIDANIHENYYLYMGGTSDMNGKLRYFPGPQGMNVQDNASLELGNNFEYSVSGWFNVSRNNTLVYKKQAFVMGFTEEGNLTAQILRGADSTDTITTASSSGSKIIYANLTRSQAFIADLSMFATYVDLYLAYIGIIHSPVVVTLQGANEDNSPNGNIMGLAVLNSSELAGTETATDFYFENPVYIRDGAKYCVVISLPESPNANNRVQWHYNASTTGPISSYSDDWGGNWTADNRWFKGAFIGTLANQTISATGLKTGERWYRVWADNTTLNIDVNGVTVSTIPSTNRVNNNGHNWTNFRNGSVGYVEYQEIWVNGTLQQQLDVGNWDDTNIWKDISGHNHHGYMTFKEWPSPYINATLKELSPVQVPIAVYNAVEMVVNLTNNISAPPPNYATENMSPSFFGADYWNTLMDAGGIPRSFVWFPVAFGFSILAGFGVYGIISKSSGNTGSALLAQAITSGVVMGFFSMAGIVPWYCVPIFAIEALAIVLAQKHYGW